MATTFKLLDDCRVSQTTFGNQVNWTMKKGEKFVYGLIVEQNQSFTVFQNGLNYYVFETRCIPPVPQHWERD
ncbi:hypothetical protein C4565_00515 [Candidatus Parcubacteria bacterium]|nr:MAG: hypothetical protein C4565_00515 [Candidatus Parcubacteria bacterium]